MSEAPPYRITPEILSLVEQVGEGLGRAEALGIARDLRLRRISRIRSIRGSLAIEGNTLSEEQVATLLDGKPVLGSPREIQEARNAIKAYDRYESWAPESEGDLLSAHGVLMAGLLDDPGRYRRGGVAVGGAGVVHHVAPPAGRVPELMAALLHWMRSTADHPLIVSSVFHYEFEFIHPFEDGNGRLGRLWQTLVLTRWQPLFAHLPVESLVHAHQSAYYGAIRASSAAGESTPFITFMLQMIRAALAPTVLGDQVDLQVTDQVERLLNLLRDGPHTAAQLLARLGLSHRPTLRANYLRPALALGLVEMTHPESPTAKNQAYRLTARGRRAAV
ncbi:MAG: Fic family protein [Spirochaetaceae bacterium]|nr:Fic family protein [Spirochaetaceae bacterium]